MNGGPLFTFDQVGSLVAWIVAGILAMGGWVFAIDRTARGRDRELHEKIDKRERESTGRDDRLHTRVDEVKDHYVRRDDLDKMQAHIDSKIDRLFNKIDDLQKQIAGGQQ